ncbi:cytochrome P450 [Streptomyces sp. Li-HN-5-11]|uniref:cytochrome P450 n=1 Tax=Streptomyces sp. Li-HN-5-11 TaxID=3075432 RepID=UPI0028A89FF6|nr:cytochrome P450 [Streptomyces sp. Li-HN-5-11]WNM31365.1 cytochrome P450 [Streptomyces sp. Li-HN-5-11]
MTTQDVGVRTVDATADALFTAALWGDQEADPYEDFRRLRERAPVLLTRHGTLVLSRYADAHAMFRDPAVGRGDEAFASLRGKLPDHQVEEVEQFWRSSLMFSNPPAHTRVRRVFNRSFTPQHVARLRGPIGADVEHALDRLEERRTSDFMEDVARSLPVDLVARLLGVPPADRAGFQPLVRDLVSLLEPGVDAEGAERGLHAQRHLSGYFTELLAHKRAHPADDLLSRLATDGEGCSDTELAANSVLLFVAAFETTSNLLGQGVNALVTHPEEQARLRRDPGLVPHAVEEFLRFDPPTVVASRSALRFCTIAGVDLAPGQLVIAMIGGANRDPDRYDDPDRLDVGRRQGPGLTFTSGAHMCLGAHLTRLQAGEFFARLIGRFPHIEYADSPLRYPSRLLRGFHRLPITVHARRTARRTPAPASTGFPRVL